MSTIEDNPKVEQGKADDRMSSEKDPGGNNNNNDEDPSNTTLLPKDPSKVQRLARKFMYLSYCLGLVWTSLHPILSILTGETKSRGWYLDEHSIEIKFAELSSWEPPSHFKIASMMGPGIVHADNFLCRHGAWTLLSSSNNNVACHTHGNYFSMLQITPMANALDPLEEALVFVVPNAEDGDWTSRSTFHSTLLLSLERMADPIHTPWLAKTLIVVSPVAATTTANEATTNTSATTSSRSMSTSPSLEETVEYFLNAYMGSSRDVTASSSSSSPSSSLVPPLPPKFSTALLRSLVVLDLQDYSTTATTTPGRPLSKSILNDQDLGRTDFSILPQGRKGILPNLDLVFLLGKLFSRAMYLSPQKYPNSTMLVHPYTKLSRQVQAYIQSPMATNDPVREFLQTQSPRVKEWIQSFADMTFFGYTLAVGPYPPHAVALERGIDAISLQIRFHPGQYHRDPAIETIQYWEYFVRSLSNLHERLHHSFTLYWMPSPRHFVSHMEYFLPNLLVLLPLAIRAFGTVWWEMKEYGLDLTTMGVALLVTVISTGLTSMVLQVLSSQSQDAILYMTNTWLLCLYVAIVIVWKATVLSKSSSGDQIPPKQRQVQSLQVLACVLAAHILSPIAFAHTALSYAPSLLWTPLLAFWNYRQLSKLGKVLVLGLLVATAPPMLLVPRIWDSYTPFVQFAYLPLHILLLLLVATSLL